MVASSPPEIPDLNAEEVTAWLQHHPEVLARLLGDEENLPDTTESVVDLQPFLMARLRREMDAIKSSAEDLIHTSRENMSTQGRTHEAILAMLDAEDFATLSDILSERVPLMLELDACVLCLETGPQELPDEAAPYITPLPQGMVDLILGKNKPILLREKVEDGVNLYGPAAGLVCSDALVRLTPGYGSGDPLPQALLALGARKEGTFYPGQGMELLTFFASVLERVIYRLARR